MLSYPDRRGRYTGRPQWDVPAATGRVDNPKAVPEAKTTTAQRDPVESAPSGSRKYARVTTTEDPELLQKQGEQEALAKREAEEAQRAQVIQDAQIDIPPASDFDLDSTGSDTSVSMVSESSDRGENISSPI